MLRAELHRRLSERIFLNVAKDSLGPVILMSTGSDFSLSQHYNELIEAIVIRLNERRRLIDVLCSSIEVTLGDGDVGKVLKGVENIVLAADLSGSLEVLCVEA